MKTQRIITIGLLALLLPAPVISQSIERGYVKEYHGEQAKTPLAGVELNIAGAPTTVSGDEGQYELKFAKLKPGESVSCNEIYKQGYVIFNKAQLENWRISNNQTPFVIVMCREDRFRETKRYYDGIIRKAYEKELAQQKALAQQLASNNEDLKTRMKQIESEYEEKISNINTYVELFSRIDRSETEDARTRALQLIEKEQIDEAVRVYNEIDLKAKADEQIRKLKAGQNVVQAGQRMVEDSQQDLLMLIETAKEKVGVYQMGGSKYDHERNELISQMIDWYTALNEATGGRYNEELGQWTCTYADYVKLWLERTADYERAAALPSWHGLHSLAKRQLILAYSDPQCLEKARSGLKQALSMQPSDSIRKDMEQMLALLPDFPAVLPSGDTIYLKCNTEAGTVTVWPRTPYCANRVKGSVTLPHTVTHNGQEYRITAIGDKAFYRNLHLSKMTLPDGVRSIGNIAFMGCTLDTLVVGKNLMEVDNYALPQSTLVLVPKKLAKAKWYLRHEHKRDSLNLIAQQPQEEKPFEQLIDEYRKATTEAEKKAAKSELLKHYVKVVQQESKKEQRRQPEGFPAIEYEEMVSIGIIAMQAIIKGKTIDELAKRDDKYLSTAIKWAIRNELRQRYDWYAYVTKYYMGDDERSQDNAVQNSSKRQMIIHHYTELLKDVARQYFDLQPDINYRLEYEEIVAMGVLGLQAFIKDKDGEILSKYNDAYVEQVIKWYIMQMMPIRHEWFNDKYLESWSKI